MAIANIGKRRISYPTAADMGLSASADVEPVIISQCRSAHTLTNIRLSLEEVEPVLVVERLNKRTLQAEYANLDAETLNKLYETARERHVVGIMQTHLATELNLLIKKGAFSVEAPDSQVHRKIA